MVNFPKGVIFQLDQMKEDHFGIILLGKEDDSTFRYQGFSDKKVWEETCLKLTKNGTMFVPIVAQPASVEIKITTKS